MSETTKKPVLETMHLGISFGGLHAVQDFNLSIYSGELVGLIGANGAGKTTTLHAISGLLRSASGSITLDGTDLQSVPANSIIRMGLAHVPEGRQTATILSPLGICSAFRRRSSRSWPPRRTALFWAGAPTFS